MREPKTKSNIVELSDQHSWGLFSIRFYIHLLFCRSSPVLSTKNEGSPWPQTNSSRIYGYRWGHFIGSLSCLYISFSISLWLLGYVYLPAADYYSPLEKFCRLWGFMPFFFRILLSALKIANGIISKINPYSSGWGREWKREAEESDTRDTNKCYQNYKCGNATGIITRKKKKIVYVQ